LVNRQDKNAVALEWENHWKVASHPECCMNYDIRNLDLRYMVYTHVGFMIYDDKWFYLVASLKAFDLYYK
jgi:hypothetical protein